jgi:membrane protein implicated in regulation of membrane protease activity
MTTAKAVFFKSQIPNPNSEIVMMWYVLIGLSLSLACVAGLQFFYMLYLERISDERKKRISELERHTKQLTKRLGEAERQIAEQNEILQSMFDEYEEEEIWADVIEDR